MYEYTLLDGWKRNNNSSSFGSASRMISQCSPSIQGSLHGVFEQATAQSVASGQKHPRDWSEPTFPIVP